MAEALAYAHTCGVVHRDVKPSNIFIGSKDTVKLGDFGLAGLAGEESCDRSGTKKYMAPEQCASGKVDAKSDQYAFGATMLELAAPFPDLLRNRDFAAILSKATAEDPEARYPGMTTLASDLGRFLRHEPVLAHPAGAVRRFILWTTRSPAAAAGVIVAVTLLIALITSLAVGYIRTSRALAATEHEAENTARALIAALTATSAPDGEAAAPTLNGKRLAKLKTALRTIEELARRYPENVEIPAAAEKLRRAIRFTELHGDPPRRSLRKFSP